mmetsp:Transcript_36887/g.98250  ORF Transcript_36887/g.98250 Transcript_36887/m.98250 type:complete len:224 (+) Transcript_36887:230-901(+)
MKTDRPLEVDEVGRMEVTEGSKRALDTLTLLILIGPDVRTGVDLWQSSPRRWRSSVSRRADPRLVLTLTSTMRSPCRSQEMRQQTSCPSPVSLRLASPTCSSRISKDVVTIGPHRFRSTPSPLLSRVGTSWLALRLVLVRRAPSWCRVLNPCSDQDLPVLLVEVAVRNPCLAHWSWHQLENSQHRFMSSLSSSRSEQVSDLASCMAAQKCVSSEMISRGVATS